MDDRSAPGRDVMLAAGMACAAFVLVSWLTTQVVPLRAALPFTEDPYDAVVSFALIGVAVVGSVTGLRAAGQVRQPRDVSVARRIAIGATLAAAIGAVALASDIVALFVVGVDTSSSVADFGVALVAIAAAMTIVALGLAWRDRAALTQAWRPSASEPDLLDALGSILSALGARRTATTLMAWADRSATSPRRHRLLVGFLGAAAAGLGAVVWHAIREGPWVSPAAAALFGLFAAIGVGTAYLLSLGPLRILRRPGAG